MKLLAVILATVLILAPNGWAQTSAFTYQGQLRSSGVPANGTFDLTFNVFASATGGTPLTSPISNPGVAVSAGVFTVVLDFGAGVFDGSNRWLEIGVRPAGSGGAFTTLAPRQPITATPYASKAASATSYAGPISDSQLSLNIPRLSGGNFSLLSGRIGVGTSAPNRALQVISAPSGKAAAEFTTSGLQAYGVAAVLRTAGGHDGAALLFRSRDVKNWTIRGEPSDGTGFQINEDGGDDSEYGAGNGTPRMHFAAGGNVGIGTTTPIKRLQVIADPAAGKAAAEFTSSGSQAFGVAVVLRTLSGPDSPALVFRNRDVKNWTIRGEPSNGTGFQINEDGADFDYGPGNGTPRMHFASGGNVGIGTTSPGALLDTLGRAVVGGSTAGRNSGGDATYALNVIDSGANQFRMVRAGVVKADFQLNSSPTRLDLVDTDHSAVVPLTMKLDGTGNVGVGTTSPNQKLTVAGMIRSTSGGIMYPDGSIQTVAQQIGPTGPTGPAGADGKTVRSGSGAPSASLGVNGDFYINTAANTIYGPKTNSGWGSPTSLVGPQGEPGIETYAMCEDAVGGVDPVTACNSRCGGAAYRDGYMQGNCTVTSNHGPCTAHTVGSTIGLCCVCKSH